MFLEVLPSLEYWRGHINNSIWNFTASCSQADLPSSSSALPEVGPESPQETPAWTAGSRGGVGGGGGSVLVTDVIPGEATGGQQLPPTLYPRSGEDTASRPIPFLKQQL